MLKNPTVNFALYLHPLIKFISQNKLVFDKLILILRYP